MSSVFGLDIETYSSAPLPKCGVYRYCDAPDFEILLFAYAFDDEPVKSIDLASGETLPKEVISTLKDPGVIKVAYNAQFERVCLSCYLGHSHTPEKMRLRLIIPLTRTVTPDEYAAVSRRIADDLGLLRFDPTTFKPARLMYWPSTPEDGDFFFHCEDAPFLDPDEVLKTYADWRDASLWPTTQPVEECIRHTAGKQEDPTEKRGIIGAFCRAHTITDVLTELQRRAIEKINRAGGVACRAKSVEDVKRVIERADLKARKL